MALSDYFCGSQPIASGSVDAGHVITITLANDITCSGQLQIVAAGGADYNPGGNSICSMQISSVTDSRGGSSANIPPEYHLGASGPPVLGDGSGHADTGLSTQTFIEITAAYRNITAGDLLAGDTITTTLHFFGNGSDLPDSVCHAVLLVVLIKGVDLTTAVTQHGSVQYQAIGYPDFMTDPPGSTRDELLYSDDFFSDPLPHPDATCLAVTAAAGHPAPASYTPNISGEDELAFISGSYCSLHIGGVDHQAGGSDVDLGGTWSSQCHVMATSCQFYAFAGGLRAWQRF